MSIIESFVFGLVQALTEFLPISSSGHLVILHQIWPSELLDNLTFDTILHGGTLVAILIFFWSDWVKIIRAVWQSIFAKQHSLDSRLGWAVVIATIPAGLIGFKYGSKIEDLLRSKEWVVIALIVGALLLWLAEKISKKNRDLNSLSWRESLGIGCLQVLSLVPGFSRSGSTITGGLLFGLTRAAAVRFSFLLSAPIIGGAFLKQLFDLSWSSLNNSVVTSLLVGFLTSAVVGYLVIKWLLKFINNHSFLGFVWYRIILAVLIVLILK